MSHPNGPVPFSPPSPRIYIILAVIVAVGAMLRLGYNDLTTFSPADERQYVDYAREFVVGGWGKYPEVVQNYLNTPWRWDFPNPLRWGHFAITSAACIVHAPCDGTALAWLSTWAGIASIPLTFFIGLELLGSYAALLGAAFVATSPLQLALGRRALQDELYCAVVLGALWALLVALRKCDAPKAARSSFLAAGAVMTLAFAIKETSLIMVFPGWIALVIAHARSCQWRWRWAHGLLLVVPPVAQVLGFMLFSHSLTSYYAVVQRQATAAMNSVYGAQYTSGPAHIPLVDFFLLSPIVFLGAIAGIVVLIHKPDEVTAGAKRLALVFGVGVASALIATNNIRYSVALDPLMRLLCAWTLAEFTFRTRKLDPLSLFVLVTINGVMEFALFKKVFITHSVYDPTTYDLLRALEAIPRL